MNGPPAIRTSNDRGRSVTEDDGFTLIELLVVVLIVAVLLAIAIPTYAGARRRAGDRAAQSVLRNALATEKIFYTGALRYADDSAGDLSEIEPGMTYAATSTPSASGVAHVSVWGGDVVYLSTLSTSGTCFYLVDDAVTGTGYAQDEACGPADSQSYVTGGW